MTEDKLNFSNVIGIAGKMGSGKTDFAKRLSQELQIPRSSFGAFIRSEAYKRKQSLERTSLQKLGDQMIKELTPYGFLLEFQEMIPDSQLHILDGVRHREIWEQIVEQTPKTFLVFFDIHDEVRLERLIARDQSTKQETSIDMSHPMENQINLLRPYANLVFDEVMPLEIMVDAVKKKLN